MKKNIRCKLFGHKWLFKDYTHNVDSIGQKLPYIKSRICTRCHQRETTKDNKLWIQSYL
ncbi:MAG TPA: hypothetical protein VJY62_00125 [Bacteroidia bacterium]|nr:hypothetical protein [Bacteroidia bacterium]